MRSYPLPVRREAWEQLQRQGLRLPDLVLSERDHKRNLWIVLKATLSSALHLQSWYALLFALSLMFIVYWGALLSGGALSDRLEYRGRAGDLRNAVQ